MTTAFHVTPRKNLRSIRRRGLLPHQNQDLLDGTGVYLFPTREDMENALWNWLGERFEEDAGDLVALELDLTGLPVEADPDVGFEIWCSNPIPWDRVREIIEI